MSQNEDYENLLIDFNNVNLSDDPSDVDQTQSSSMKAEIVDSSSAKQASHSLALLCSSQPLYKLLQRSESVEDNNPFDHLDKQAGLLDDPFEIVENAALISSDLIVENGTHEVETGTLISIDSPINVKTEPQSSIHSQTLCDTPKTCSTSNDNKCSLLKDIKSHDSVQNTSQKQLLSSANISPKSSASPTGRSKAKNTSLILLKYSLSNSRLDLANENVSPGEETFCGDETLQKKSKIGSRRNSTTDDSFDDIWATKPNLIDSQTDIDIDSDVDNDIANLNIPMLNSSMSCSKPEGNGVPEANDEMSRETAESKAVIWNGILEKLASIKLRVPQSPAPIGTTTIPIHNQTVDIKCSQARDVSDGEPVTPKSQFSSVVLPQSLPDDTNSLIEHLKKMVDQCDDKSKQMTAKHLLDDLRSILTKTNETGNNEMSKHNIDKRQPVFSQLKRQGTFSIEKNDCNDTTEGSNVSDVNGSNEKRSVDTKDNKMNGLSQVMKQIQNAFGSHQNINVLQTNDQPIAGSTAPVNPTYIVVMAQPQFDSNEEITTQRPHRSRSQSLTLKEKPLAAIRAAQQKFEQSQVQSSVVATPIKRPILQRRSSFGTIIRKPPNAEIEVPSRPMNPVDKPNTQKVIRRRSLQCPAVKQEEPEKNHPKPPNPVVRRRSFQGTSTAPGIRSPSPKATLNLGRGPIRPNPNTTGTLTRRKSFATDLTKDSPQKLRSSYGIMKKPPPPATTRNLKIRVSQGANGRSSAPLRAVVPMKQVASLLLINETVSPVEDSRNKPLITSTPRSSIPSPAKSKKGMNENLCDNPQKHGTFLHQILIFPFLIRNFNWIISFTSGVAHTEFVQRYIICANDTTKASHSINKWQRYASSSYIV